MFSKQTQWIAAALIGVPLAVAGCGGGGSGGSSVTPTGTPVATPVPTPVPTAVNSINLKFSAASGVSVPAAATYTDGSAQTYTQAGYNVLSAAYNLRNGTYGLSFNVSKLGIIKSGDSFNLANINGGVSDETLIYNYGSKVYEATSGTVKIVSLVNRPATGTSRATITVNFTVTNAILHELSPAASNDLTLNATGQCTVQDFGPQPTPIPIPTPFPGPTPLPPTTSFRFDVALSNRVKVTLPAALHLTQGTGSTYNRLGFDTQNVIFSDPVSTYSFQVNVSKSGEFIKVGNSLPLSPRDFGNNAVVASKPGQNLVFISNSGTYKLNSLVKKPATRTSRATTSATFTLSDVQMVGPSSDDPSLPDGRFTINGTGSFTVEDTGPQ